MLQATESSEGPWVVETGKGRAKYDARYEFAGPAKAIWYFNCLNTHSGYKKRLTHNGKVIARVIT